MTSSHVPPTLALQVREARLLKPHPGPGHAARWPGGLTPLLAHINALNTLAQAMVTGCGAVFETRFSASGFWPTMRQRGATVVYLLGAMGWLLPGFEARVVHAQDVSLPDGTAGELLLRADEPFGFASGYFGMPDKTMEAWRNLWFHTGDRVVREADGAFRFIDRIKDAIRRRGENISSYEVEQVLLSHPDVATAAVFPVGSELAEDEVMAALVARPGRVLDPAELTQFCESRLP